MNRFLMTIALAAVTVFPASVGAQASPKPTPPTNPYVINRTIVRPSYHVPWQHPWWHYGYGHSYGAGSVLAGQAEVVRAYGAATIDIEEARIRREQANQAKLDTQKARFDLQQYIRANTPTFAQEQAQLALRQVERIRTSALPAEISSGSALNLLLEHYRGAPHRLAALSQTEVSAQLVSQLNVTAGSLGIGALRDGRINWPVSLASVTPPALRQALDIQAKQLVSGALSNGVDANLHRDFSAGVERLSDLVASEITRLGANYLQARRFVTELQEAAQALGQGQARHQSAFAAWVGSEGGKSPRALIEHMLANGLRFASATRSEEGAYRAVFDAMLATELQRGITVGAAGVGQ